MIGGQEGGNGQGVGALGDRGDGHFGDGLQNPCSTLKEGATVNVDVTAPGATLALGILLRFLCIPPFTSRDLTPFEQD